MASDNAVWKALFLSRWAVDLRKANGGKAREDDFQRNVRTLLGRSWEVDVTINVGQKAKRLLGLDSSNTAAQATPYFAAPLRLDWRLMFRERLELEKRWNNVPVKAADAWIHTSGGSPVDNQDSFQQVALKPFQPNRTQLVGHSDRFVTSTFTSITLLDSPNTFLQRLLS